LLSTTQARSAARATIGKVRSVNCSALLLRHGYDYVLGTASAIVLLSSRRFLAMCKQSSLAGEWKTLQIQRPTEQAVRAMFNKTIAQ
jgi:hypothetical protein